jgi:gas vesicle structural protein
VVDLLDRVLDRGVTITGDVILSVAGVDLVYVGIRLVLKGVDGTDAIPS